MKCFCLLLLVFLSVSGFGQNTHRWNFERSGGIEWHVKTKPHIDHIEMSGLQVSAIVHYGIDSTGELLLNKRVVYPMLRTIPNNTHASLIVDFNDYKQLQISVNNKSLAEYPKELLDTDLSRAK